MTSLFRRCLSISGLALVLMSSMALTACDRNGTSKPSEAFLNTDLTGLDYVKDFTLTDQNGKTRSLKDFRGKAVVVFFGYTQCPDFCPTTMVEMANMMKQLGSQAERVQVIFITIDPARDTQELLASYVPNFDKRFLGLRGSEEDTQKIVKEFKAFYQKSPGKTPDSYTMDHTAASYVFDPEGRLRLYVAYGQKSEAIAHDVKLLLQ